jgi:PAS domain-containing protein
LAQCLAILAPSGRDSIVIHDILASAGVRTCIEGNVPAVLSALNESRAGAAILAEEALSDEGLEQVQTWLSNQPPWSDLPVILLTKGRGGPGTKMEIASRLGNVTILERPLHPVTLVSAARAALRARARQHVAERYVIDLEQSQRRLSESEEKYRTLFNTMDEGFCIIEFIDGPDGPLSDYVHVEANEAYARHAGIPNVVGQKVREMVPDEAGEWSRSTALSCVPVSLSASSASWRPRAGTSNCPPSGLSRRNAARSRCCSRTSRPAGPRRSHFRS